MNSVLSKSSTSTAGQRSENKVKAERNIKYAQSMGQMQIVKPKQLKRIKSLLSHSVHPSHSKSNNNNDKSDGILTSLPYTLNGLDDKIEPSDWKTALMNELDAKQYEISNKSNLLKYRHGYNSDSNELVINTSQPSCIDNKKPNHHNLAAMEEKLGAISKKTMINDWLHYNSIPNSANTDMPITSYLQHYQYSDNQEMFSKKEFGHTTNQERLSILSAQLKKQGKQKHDHIKEKLDIAAARRNVIKTNRRREQMDTALFETMNLIRKKKDCNNNNLLEQEDLNQLFYNNSEKKGTRKIYVSDTATSSSSLSNNNDCYFFYQ
ncbi:hypothetical protein INT48_006051 [Thamnidium elegans]|uniref:Uncharacterized protein n=1 Tax=Thamnidium elegans TaxID=101142 RepID=A0A8H7SLU4_9FUNG|nr:hypothetical protein INT48_006051 [Thamnidium elegans]